MYAVIGASGQTGSAVARNLLAAGQAVRVIVRKAEQAESWQKLGAEFAIASLTDGASLAAAFAGCAGAYLMNPTALMAEDFLAQAKLSLANEVDAANQAGLARIVGLSSAGGQHAEGTGNILTNHELELQMERFHGQCTIVRAANFMENWGSSLATVTEKGVLPSMLLPLDRAIPMVATADIGRLCAELLMDGATGNRLVNLHGPRDYSPLDVAAALTALLGKTVTAVEVPEAALPDLFRSFGFPPATVAAFCEMTHAINSGHVSFDDAGETRRGVVTIEQVLTGLLKMGR